MRGFVRDGKYVTTGSTTFLLYAADRRR